MRHLRFGGKVCGLINLCLFTICLLWQGAQAATITATVILDWDDLIDAQVAQAYPNTNYGTNQFLHIRSTWGSLYYSYIQFPLSSIPDNATITAADLSLYIDSKSGSPTVNFYHTDSDLWSEDLLTWNNQPGFNALIYSAKAGTSWYTFSLLPTWQYQTDLNDNYLSLGFMTDTKNRYVYFRSSDHYNRLTRPYLIITYEYEELPPPNIPSPSTILLLGTGLLGLAALRWRHR